MGRQASARAESRVEKTNKGCPCSKNPYSKPGANFMAPAWRVPSANASSAPRGWIKRWLPEGCSSANTSGRPASIKRRSAENPPPTKKGKRSIDTPRPLLGSRMTQLKLTSLDPRDETTKSRDRRPYSSEFVHLSKFFRAAESRTRTDKPRPGSSKKMQFSIFSQTAETAFSPNFLPNMLPPWAVSASAQRGKMQNQFMDFLLLEQAFRGFQPPLHQ